MKQGHRRSADAAYNKSDCPKRLLFHDERNTNTIIIHHLVWWLGGDHRASCARQRAQVSAFYAQWTNRFRGRIAYLWHPTGQLPALQDWNEQESWRSEYGELIKKNLVFLQRMCSATSLPSTERESSISTLRTDEPRPSRIRFLSGCRSFLRPCGYIGADALQRLAKKG